MEGKRYSLERAHDEAEKISKKVEAGEASNYSDAELKLEREVLDAKEKIINFLNKGRIYDALFIQERCQLPIEVLHSDKIQSAIKKVIISCLESRDFDSILKIQEELQLPAEVMHSAIKERIIFILKYENFIDSILKIQEELQLPAEVLQSDEVQSAIKERIIKSFKNGYISHAIEIQEKFQIPDEVIQSAAKESIVHLLQNGGISHAFAIKEKFQIPDEFMQSVARGSIMICIQKGYIDSALAIKEKFQIPDEFMQSVEIQLLAKERIAKILKYKNSESRDFDIALEIKEKLQLPSEVMESVFREIIVHLLQNGGISHAFAIKEKFQIPDEVIQSAEVQSAAKELIISSIKDGYINYTLSIKEKFQIPDEVIQSAEVQSAAKKGILHFLKHVETFDDAFAIQEKLQLPAEVLQSAAKESIVSSLDSIRLIDFALKIKEKFQIPDEVIQSAEVQSAAKEAIMSHLKSKYFDAIHKIKEKFQIPDEVIQSAEVQSAAKEAIMSYLQEGYIDFDAVSKIQETFQIPNIDQFLASNIDVFNLIHFISKLGNDKFISLFPNFFEKIKTEIFNNLSQFLDLADYFLENLPSYYKQPWVAEGLKLAVSHYSVADKFISAFNDNETIWKNEPWVKDIWEVANAVVVQYDDNGSVYEGFSESDPFENDPLRFGERQVKVAAVISDVMAGKSNLDALKHIGINNEELPSLLVRLNEKINISYKNFLEQIRSNPAIKDEDKIALLDPGKNPVHMVPLIDNIRSFVARYIVQLSKGNNDEIESSVDMLLSVRNSSNSLYIESVLEEGFERYLKIYEVDIPLYDKLYEEFDNLRETGRSPLEVYLGRDGIYAYVGRRAQDVARRRKLGLKGRERLKEMGEVIEIRPQYVVYPRYFRDNIRYETKREFLEQEGITSDADPLFYDTGYTGTIPEQIMRVMDFDEDEIEQRIRLLSAPSASRRVKGIPENARQEIIEYIEHNAKIEEAAVGLIKDEKTGKIRHIAEPTSPEEQFNFMMIKQAIARHYWLHEQLHHESSGNINLDSEHYTIRIRQEYSKLLPPEFIKDPKSFLAQQGELLKGSKSEGKYPDEEIVLFKMIDGTEIVAKKVELRKAKEARKEFSILISAKKAGLPTAEPVGFLSGKEEVDGSYLLMKKIEGISGRNFGEYLRKLGKFTEEKIISILQEVAQKNKEAAEIFRTTLNIDKRWRIKDTMIEFNEETGEVLSVIPIDWERAGIFNPENPKEIDEIES